MIITDSNFVKTTLPEIPGEANKFTRGRLLLAVGSFGMAGAAVMAVRAALRTGAGFTDLAVPARLYPVIAAAVPESVVTVYDEADPVRMEEVLAAALEKANAVVMGCGFGKLREAVCTAVLRNARVPMVLDADALNAMALQEDLRPLCPERTVLTPHEGEMARLLHVTSPEVRADREGSIRKAREIYGTNVLLKGPGTLILDASGAAMYENPTVNAGMARAGSGDVLAGIIGALMAQGADPFRAAVSGAYLHGLAGDLAAERFGIRSMLPTDLIECIPEALRRIGEEI
ncbi:MAG: NAD(P)H-hydrate dehydratase [Lachnospiraceae bacterium]|nr:NAD(P)H-hydrate dehydratase [Lachnospiraceae bacterium]